MAETMDFYDGEGDLKVIQIIISVKGGKPLVVTARYEGIYVCRDFFPENAGNCEDKGEIEIPDALYNSLRKRALAFSKAREALQGLRGKVLSLTPFKEEE